MPAARRRVIRQDDACTGWKRKPQGPAIADPCGYYVAYFFFAPPTCSSQRLNA